MSEHDKHYLLEWAEALLQLHSAEQHMRSIKERIAAGTALFAGDDWRGRASLEPGDWIPFEKIQAAFNEWHRASQALTGCRAMLKGSAIGKLLPRHSLEKE